jgi:hypothetical protein
MRSAVKALYNFTLVYGGTPEPVHPVGGVMSEFAIRNGGSVLTLYVQWSDGRIEQQRVGTLLEAAQQLDELGRRVPGYKMVNAERRR